MSATVEIVEDPWSSCRRERRGRARIVAAVALVVSCSAAAPGISQSPWRFVDVATELGVTALNLHGGEIKDFIVQANGNGAGLFDYDSDGDLDIAIVSGSTLAAIETGGDPMLTLYRNDGERFRDVTQQAGLERRGWGMGLCVADIDNDGDDDLYLTAYGANVLFRNAGDGSFEEATAASGLADERWSSSCAFGDYDRDGQVDLYVTNYLHFSPATTARRGDPPGCKYLGRMVFCGPLGLTAQADALWRNLGAGSFREVTASAGLESPDAYGLAVLFADLDDDGWPELVVGNDSQSNYLFHNRRDGTFSEVGLLAGIALSSEAIAQASMGIAVGDTDRDGDLDLLFANFSQDHNTYYRNNGHLLFADRTFPAGLGGTSIPQLAWGTAFIDLDNDGWSDLVVANGHIYHDVAEFGIGSTYREPNQLYANVGGERFHQILDALSSGDDAERSSRGLAYGDIDNDGDQDLLFINLNQRPTLLRNEVDGGSFLTMRFVGRSSNAGARGTRATLRAGDATQLRELISGDSYLSHSDSRLHFGTGSIPVDAVELRWPSGIVQRLTQPGVDRFLVIREPDSGAMTGGD